MLKARLEDLAEGGRMAAEVQLMLQLMLAAISPLRRSKNITDCVDIAFPGQARWKACCSAALPAVVLL